MGILHVVFQRSCVLRMQPVAASAQSLIHCMSGIPVVDSENINLTTSSDTVMSQTRRTLHNTHLLIHVDASAIFVCRRPEVFSAPNSARCQLNCSSVPSVCPSGSGNGRWRSTVDRLGILFIAPARPPAALLPPHLLQAALIYQAACLSSARHDPPSGTDPLSSRYRPHRPCSYHRQHLKRSLSSQPDDLPPRESCIRD